MGVPKFPFGDRLGPPLLLLEIGGDRRVKV